MAQTSLWEVAEAGAWVMLAAFLAFFGNGEHDVITLLWASSHVNRLCRDVWVVCLGLNVALFLYLYVGWGLIARCKDVYAAAPWAAPIGACSLVAGAIAFTAAIWPTFGLLSPVLVVIYSFGLLMSLHFLPLGLGPLALPRRTQQQQGNTDGAVIAVVDASMVPAKTAEIGQQCQAKQQELAQAGLVTQAGVIMEQPVQQATRPRRKEA